MDKQNKKLFLLAIIQITSPILLPIIVPVLLMVEMKKVLPNEIQ